MEPQYKQRNFWSFEITPIVAKQYHFWRRLILWLILLNRALWVLPKDIDQRLQQAEDERRELNSHPSLWLK